MGYRYEDDEDQFGAPTAPATMGDLPPPTADAQPANKVDLAAYLKTKYGQAADTSGVQDAYKKKAIADGVAGVAKGLLSSSTPGVTYMKSFQEHGAPVREDNINSNIDTSPINKYGDMQVQQAQAARQAKTAAFDKDNQLDEQARKTVREDKQDSQMDLDNKFKGENQDQTRKGWDVTNRGNAEDSPQANQARLLLQSTLIQKSKAARSAGAPDAADALMEQAKSAGQGMSANEIMGLHNQVKDLNYDDILNNNLKKSTMAYNQASKTQLNDQHNDRIANQAATKLAGDLEGFRGDPGGQQASKNKLAVANAMSIINGAKDPNNLNSNELAMLSAELGRIATGGVASEHAMGEMSADNLQSRAAKLQQFLTSNPAAANQGGYVANAKKYLQELDKNADDYIGTRRSRQIDGNKMITEEHRQELRRRFHLDGDSGQPSAPQQPQPAAATSAPLAPADQQAIEWAKANPNAPQSAKILQLHGM